MRPVAHLADQDDAIAFAAFHTLVSPALRAVARGPLRRARHSGRACEAPVGAGWCAECEASADDLVMESFTRLRAALVGPLPTTRSGEPVREMALVCEHLMSAEAGEESTAALAVKLRDGATEGEDAWLRAARAQLVHYPLGLLEERVRRADAVRRGASARPERDLRQAAWAAPLRQDATILDLLVLAVFRARRGVPELFDVPDDLRERHDLSRAEAARRMAEALCALRKTNPAFFAANIGDAVPSGLDVTVDGPEDQLEAAASREAARATMRRLLAGGADEPVAQAGRRLAYRAVVAAVCAVGSGRRSDPLEVAEAKLGLAPRPAGRLVRRLAVLVAAAGVDWSERLTVEPPTGGSPRRAGRRPGR
ncbi:hypothetical protein [Actinomadura sp. 7K507]|uniref:hypothetical protein n=1 Tax=Actinomadura sp. 7K507 TaxID=2530365 RepID=UPI001051C425|nr:hypothetical protein [Actinomadura sp. 7K507]TDC84513.1 hypothetical protein E1285_26640 [Actinomadura sp. 7K507]